MQKIESLPNFKLIAKSRFLAKHVRKQKGRQQ